MVKSKMYLDDETYEEIKGEVAHYLAQCGMSYPLNADVFARRMEMNFIPYSTLGIEAYIAAMRTSRDSFLCEKNYGPAYIFFNDEKMKERRDMSVLHEVGHQVLDHNSTPNKSDEVKESEAKFFARYAKAPMPLIHLLPIKTVESIQKVFGLSHEAAGYALDNYKKWLEHFDGSYKDYELKILSLERGGLETFISEMNEIKKHQSMRYHQSEKQNVPLPNQNSALAQRSLYDARQTGLGGG